MESLDERKSIYPGILSPVLEDWDFDSLFYYSSNWLYTLQYTLGANLDTPKGDSMEAATRELIEIFKEHRKQEEAWYVESCVQERLIRSLIRVNRFEEALSELAAYDSSCQYAFDKQFMEVNDGILIGYQLKAQAAYGQNNIPQYYKELSDGLAFIEQNGVGGYAQIELFLELGDFYALIQNYPKEKELIRRAEIMMNDSLESYWGGWEYYYGMLTTRSMMKLAIREEDSLTARQINQERRRLFYGEPENAMGFILQAAFQYLDEEQPQQGLGFLLSWEKEILRNADSLKKAVPINLLREMNGYFAATYEALDRPFEAVQALTKWKGSVDSVEVIFPDHRPLIYGKIHAALSKEEKSSAILNDKLIACLQASKDKKIIAALYKEEIKKAEEIQKAKLALLESEKAAQQKFLNTLLFSLGIVVLALGIILLLLRGLNKSNKLLSMRQLELMEKNHLLDQLNEDLKSFAHLTAHDLKEPNRTIRSFLQIFLRREGGKLSDNGRTFIEDALRASERISLLLKDIMVFSQVTTGTPSMSKVELDEVADMAMLQLYNRIEDRGAKVTIEPDLPEIYGSTNTLSLLFQNLIGNAIKFTPAGRKPIITVSHHREGDRVKLIFADNGKGIPEDMLNSVFTAFFKGKETKSEGAGLGLSIVKRIVSQHYGRIMVESQVDVGTTFQVELPLSQPSS